MSRTQLRRTMRAGGGAVVLLAGLAAAAPARAAEGLWDRLLQTMNVKAAPAAPAPDFVERTRPDPSGLGYLPTASPHKVSPLPVKSAAEIEAAKAALDAAKARQLDPTAPKPLPSAKVPPAKVAAAKGGRVAKGTPPAAD